MRKKLIKELKNDVIKHNIYQYGEIANKLGITKKPNLFKLYIKNTIPVFCSLILITSCAIIMNNSIQNALPIIPNVQDDFFHSAIFRNILGILILINIIIFLYFTVKLIRLLISKK
jgi:hypothetical protein